MLSHLRSSKLLRTLAGVTCLAGTALAGVRLAANPLPPAAPVTQPLPATAAPPSAKPVAISDVALARAVLAAFDADPALQNVNLLVSVVDRGVVIGGPVSSEELMKRAEQVVRAVPGIESVKNTCFIEAEPDPLLRAVADRLKPSAKPTDNAALPGVAIPPAAADGFIPPVPVQPPTDLIAQGTAPKTVVAQHPNLLGAPVGILGAPVSPAQPGTVAKIPLSPVTPVTPTPATPGALTGVTGAKPADILAAVTAVRATDARFARLAVELKPDGGLFVTGSVAKAADAWDFATEVRKVQGVVRVAVDPNLVK